MANEEKVYKNRSNSFDVFLTENGTPLPDHTVVTTLEFVLPDGSIISSATNPEAFDLTQQDRLVVALGKVSSLPLGRYVVKMAVYTAEFPVSGLAWEPEILLNVVSW